MALEAAVLTRHEQIRAFFTSLDKYVRSIKIYAGKGALVQRLHDETAERLKVILAEGDIPLEVTSSGLKSQGELVTPEETVPPYVFRLFCDGVRELALHPGMDGDEIRKLADVLGADPMTAPDMVNLLEEAALAHVDFYAADALAAGKEGAEGDEALRVAGRRRLRRGRGKSREEGRRIALTADEMRALVLGEAEGWLAEAKTPVRAEGAVAQRAEAIRKQFTSRDDVKRFMGLALGVPSAEAGPSPLILSYFDASLASREVNAVAAVLAWVAIAASKGDERALNLRRALVGEARCEALAQMLEAHPKALLPTLLAAPEGISGELTQVLIRLPLGPARDSLRKTLEKAGLDLTPFYRLGLDGDDSALVLDAIERLAGSSSAEADEGLVSALGSNLTVVRRAALEALRGRTSREILQAVGRAIRDPDRDNRLLALALLRESGDSRVIPILLSAAEDPVLKNRDEAEQEAVFTSLAAFDDNRVVVFLSELVNEKNLTRQKFQLTCQIMAARSLALMGSENAQRALKDSAGRWYHPGPLKQALNQALTAVAR